MRRAVYGQSRGGGRPHRRTTDSNTMCRTSPVFALRPEKSCLERERAVAKGGQLRQTTDNNTMCRTSPQYSFCVPRRAVHRDICGGGRPAPDRQQHNVQNIPPTFALRAEKSCREGAVAKGGQPWQTTDNNRMCRTSPPTFASRVEQRCRQGAVEEGGQPRQR